MTLSEKTRREEDETLIFHGDQLVLQVASANVWMDLHLHHDMAELLCAQCNYVDRLRFAP